MHIYWTGIKEIIEETPDTRTYLMELPTDFTWEEGAHTHFALEGFNAGEKPNRSLIRHMSISTLPQEGAIGITTRIKDECSEFKSILRDMQVGEKVAIFKTHSNIPLKRQGKDVYLLSCGVGLATFRPLILDYMQNAEHISHMHSLNVDSSRQYLFGDVMQSSPEKRFTSEFVDNRKAYYEAVDQLAQDKDALFYIVGSDDFLRQNIAVLREHGISMESILIDKHESMVDEFLTI